MLLEQRDQEVDGQVDVLHQLVFVHVEVSNGNAQAEHLLHLEFDGALKVGHLLVDVVAMSEQGGEFASLVQTRSQQTRDLLDQRLGGQKGVVLLGQLLDQLLLLVQLLQVVGAHEGEPLLLGLVAMLLITKDADRELGPGNMAEPVGKRIIER